MRIREVDTLLNALKAIDSLSENRGSSVSWKLIFEEAQTIAREAIKKWEGEDGNG